MVEPRTTTLARTVSAFAPASAVWRIGIRIGFVLAFIAAYAMIFSFETAPATLHDRANSQIPGAPNGLLVLEGTFLLLPFLTAFVLLFQTSRQTLMATGSGIAVGFFGLFLLVSPFALLTAFMLLGLSANQMSGGADPGLSRAMLALFALIAISIWIVVCAFFNGKSQLVAFVIAAFITFVYLSAGWGRMRTSEYRVEQKQRRAAEATSVAALKTNYDAHRAVALLAGCLIEYHAAHPKRGFPESLSALPPSLHLPGGAACDTTLVNPGTVSGYTLTYTPQQDPANGRFTDFLWWPCLSTKAVCASTPSPSTAAAESSRTSASGLLIRSRVSLRRSPKLPMTCGPRRSAPSAAKFPSSRKTTAARPPHRSRIWAGIHRGQPPTVRMSCT